MTVGRGGVSKGGVVARTWWAITVELVEGRGEFFWPRPGRVMAAGPGHTFASLGSAIDTAFGRWDHSHLHEFRLLNDTKIGVPDPDWDRDDILDSAKTKLSLLAAGQQFLYVFDFGDGWHHLCTVDDRKVDPLDELGIRPAAPLPVFGWGDLPDQYGRATANDDGGEAVQRDPRRSDLPPFFDWWGPGSTRYAQ
jgi:hypothetical protein